jgi:hypothetical protein
MRSLPLATQTAMKKCGLDRLVPSPRRTIRHKRSWGRRAGELSLGLGLLTMSALARDILTPAATGLAASVGALTPDTFILGLRLVVAD